MDILTDISTLDNDMLFLDIVGDSVSQCIQTQPKANCKHYVDEGISADVLYNVGQVPPSSAIQNHGTGGMVDYATVQRVITEENGYDADVVPTEGSLFEYITRLKGNSQYLVMKR